ncbi:Myb-like_DNA-binding domain-containing protein [Hexamita inflata]|uniref:Myb-like DNA-binding domain-containing protein n=1 Tax=Hexamita inflata TaxID=28002 RepID=A0AA86TWI8_9EUKA|nr:Myb-like DNA-binding domain-containing protein [Hexamita inflata]
MKKQIWSDEDKQKLQQLVQMYTKNNRTNWVDVAQNIENRTANQCKTQYCIVLQRCQFKKTNFQWNFDLESKLICAVETYGKKWSFILTNYFPELTAEQLRLKYASIKKQRQEYGQICKQLTKGDQEIDVEKVKFMYKQFSHMREKLGQARNNGSLFLNQQPNIQPIDPLEAKILEKMDSVVHLDVILTKIEQLFHDRHILLKQEEE